MLSFLFWILLGVDLLGSHNLAMAGEGAPGLSIVGSQVSRNRDLLDQLLRQGELITQLTQSGGEISEIGAEIRGYQRIAEHFPFRTHENLSLTLLDQGRERLLKGGTGDAKFLLGEALNLSPTSSRVSLKAIYLSSRLGEGKILQLALYSIYYADLSQWFYAMIEIIQLLVAAGTVTLFAGLFFALACRIVELMRKIASILPRQVAPYLTPFITILLLAVPPLSGMVWAIFVWSLILVWLIPFARSVVRIVGVFLVLWGLLGGGKLWLEYQLNQPATRLFLGAAKGDFSPIYAIHFQSLAASPRSGLLSTAARGLWALSIGDSPVAISSFGDLTTDGALSKSEWVKANFGLAQYQNGAIKEAHQTLDRVYQSGGKSVPILFTLSQAEVEMLNPDRAEALVREAKSRNAEQLEILKKREEAALEGLPYISDPILPSQWFIFSHALWSPLLLAEFFLGSELPLMKGLSIAEMVILGIAAILIAPMLLTPRRRVINQELYPTYKTPTLIKFMTELFPNGAQLYGEKPHLALTQSLLLGLVLLPAALLMVRPGSPMKDFFPAFKSIYVMIVLALIAGRCIMVVQNSRSAECKPE